ncbi:MAG: transketolase [Polyangiaceae bacterium]|nr:transketolase [Polyangiaceae bacterium]
MSSSVTTYESALEQLAMQRPNLFVLTAENRAAIRGLPARLGRRFIDVGICEQTLVAMAAGLALRGRVPVVHALAPFLTLRAFEFIRTDVGLPRLAVKLIGYVPGLLSDGNGPTHQSLEDVGLMRLVPNMQVFCPADSTELLAGLAAVIDSDLPCYVRFTERPPQVEHVEPPRPGRAEWLARGRDVVLLAYGLLVAPVLEAARLLNEMGISAGVLNLRWLAPLDEAALLEAALASRLLVAVEDHFSTGGLYTAVLELLNRHGIFASVAPFSFDQRWFRPGRIDAVLEREWLTGPKLAERVMTLWSQRRKAGCA